MEHWGDPWADSQESPTKNEVTSPPPTDNTAPTLLNGFLDDAGWGNEDDSFGGWTASSSNDVTVPAAAETRVAGPSPLGKSGAIDDGPNWDAGKIEEKAPLDAGRAWARQEEDVPVANKVPSETSDTSTTIPLDEDPEPNVIAPPNRLQPDDDSSARPSTSPSETSRNEAPVESPRTSVEEGPVVGKHAPEEPGLEEDHTVVHAREDKDCGVNTADADNESQEGEFGTFVEDTQWTEASPVQEDSAYDLTEASEEPTSAHKALSSEPVVRAAAGPIAFTPAPSLFDELFPSHRDAKELEEAPDDPIYSTSGRKAWYRLTRKQTMREFNSSNGDGNYIRVTWAHSEIRAEVNKIVGRWAREDRLSGTGPGARASFYWDTPAPADITMPRGHLRTKTSIPTQRAAVAPVRQSLPPVSTNMPAAFNWSSPTVAVDPWKQDSPERRSTSSPIAPKHSTVDTIQTQELRAFSTDLTRDVEETPRQTSTETPAVAQGVAPPVTLPTSISSDPWGNLSALDATPPVPQQHAIASTDDDDDDWGEMISSPTVSTPISAFPSSTPATRDNTFSTKASTTKTPPNQEPSADKMQIARLRGTISPTSALFGLKSFVPLNAELGPIGPSILKPAKWPAAPTPTEKPVATTLEENKSEPLPEPAIVELQEEASKVGVTNPTPVPKAIDAEPVTINSGDDDFSAFAISTMSSEPTGPSTPPAVSGVPVDSMVDAWADADFSFFESSVPAVASTPSQSKPDSSGSFSVFSTPPPRSASAASSAKTFTRSPPRNLSPPSIQPLTGATNSAQRRKNEEEQVIRDILAGLPDLSYMLR
jgi:hypothetical protein